MPDPSISDHRPGGQPPACPPWCESDHQRYRTHHGDVGHVGPDSRSVRVGLIKLSGCPVEVLISVGGPGAGMFLDRAENVIGLAAIQETLGHTELAALLRKAADLMAEASATAPETRLVPAQATACPR